jgi:Glycosyl hydrolases family 16
MDGKKMSQRVSRQTFGVWLLGTAALLFATSIHGSVAASSTLDLSGYKLTFDEEFDRLDVSSRGPGTRWIAHTPWFGDFGDAKFTDPGPDFPFTVQDGILRIEARNREGAGWRSGLLASVDPKNHGFAQSFGYFEMRAKFPSGPGVWPAFWLIGRTAAYTAEIDVVEHHGDLPGFFTSAVHVWDKTGAGQSASVHQRTSVPEGSLSADFHTYGVSVEKDFIRVYFDRRQVWETPTPVEHQMPKYVLLDLALGSGFSIEKTPNPSHMFVDYVKVWERQP